MLLVLVCLAVALGLLQALGLGWLSPIALRAELHAAQVQNRSLAEALAAAQQGLAMQEQARREGLAASNSLAQELASLREDNLHLKEDLASLRSLMAPDGPSSGVRLSGFHVHMGALPGEYRWHLLVAQGGHQAQDFLGRVRLRLEYGPGELRDPLPATASGGGDGANGAQTLSFKYYGELEGSFRTAPGARPRKVWAEVWRNGGTQPVASQSYALP